MPLPQTAIAYLEKQKVLVRGLPPERPVNQNPQQIFAEELAQMNDNGGFIPLKAIAQRQEISDKYLEQIIHQLSKGGYRLVRKPEEYTVGEILRLVEGSLAPVSCLDCATPCEKIESCLTIGLYKKIQKAIDEVVDNTSLADIINDYRDSHPAVCVKEMDVK